MIVDGNKRLGQEKVYQTACEHVAGKRARQCLKEIGER